MLEINKIHCGDCLELIKKIDDKSIDSIITDPPYGIMPKGKLMRNKKRDDFKWDVNGISFAKLWFPQLYDKIKDDSFMFIFWSQKYFKEGINIFNPNRIIFWRYNNLINGGGGDFAYDYEPIFVIKKGNPKLIPGKHSCVLEFTKPQSNFRVDKLKHPTQKPIKLLKHIINISTKKNDLILDLFMGSGTTAVACKQLGRNFIGFEINEKYIKIANERLEQQTL